MIKLIIQASTFWIVSRWYLRHVSFWISRNYTNYIDTAVGGVQKCDKLDQIIRLEIQNITYYKTINQVDSLKTESYTTELILWYLSPYILNMSINIYISCDISFNIVWNIHSFNILSIKMKTSTQHRRRRNF